MESNIQKKNLMSYKKKEKLIHLAVQKDIVNVAKSLGMELIKKGNIYIWKEHDSFVLDTKKNFFYWNSQGFGGNTIKLVELIKECSFKEAISFLTEQNIEEHKVENTSIKSFQYTLKDSSSIFKIRDYLKNERKISDETIDFFYKKGVISQANYLNSETNNYETVLVFKNINMQNELKGISIQGIKKHDTQHRQYLKKIIGDGLCATKIILGNPPLNPKERSKNNPLKLVVFEAPIDMMSYYELYKEKLEDCILIAMNGLKKGVISTTLSEIFYPNAPEELKKEALDHIEKYCNTTESLKIILAVDNDEAGKKFIEDFGVTVIPVIPHIPKNKLNDNKIDWNDYLKQKKSNISSSSKIIVKPSFIAYDPLQNTGVFLEDTKNGHEIDFAIYNSVGLLKKITIDKEQLNNNIIDLIRKLTQSNTYIDFESAIKLEDNNIEISIKELEEWNNYSQEQKQCFFEKEIPELKRSL